MAALLTLLKTNNKYLLTRERVNKTWYIHTVKYCSTIKRKKMVHSYKYRMILENMIMKESKPRGPHIL